MKKGDIVLASLPMSGGSYKQRPALIINFFPPYHDCLVCGISSRLHQNIRNASYLLSDDENYFAETGLFKASIVRLNYLAVLSEDSIAGKIGGVPEWVYKEIVDNLIALIQK